MFVNIMTIIHWHWAQGYEIGHDCRLSVATNI